MANRKNKRDYWNMLIECPKCKQITPIYDTLSFVKTLIQKYIAQNKELKKLKEKCAKEDEIDIQVVESNLNEEIDIYNTKFLTQADKYEPIIQWFEKRHIQIQINHEAVDTTGFFDEIALSLGNNFDVLKLVSDQRIEGESIVIICNCLNTTIDMEGF